MNERIKQFAQQAGFKVDWQHADVQDIKMARFEKFAELIVRECAELVRIQNEQFTENESHYGVDSTDILKHFGVE